MTIYQCSHECHQDIDWPVCGLCDHESAMLCSGKEEAEYCMICGEHVELPVHDWDCYK